MAESQSDLPERLRAELEKTKGSARTEFEHRSEQAKREFEQRSDEARRELGERVVDLSEEYFPEATKRRRRRVAATAFAAGVGAGFVARHVIDR